MQPHLTRNWDYYTGLVFELRAPDGAVLCGGGRYDELVALVGGDKPVPAVGFAYYLDQMLRQTSIRSTTGRRSVTIATNPTDTTMMSHAAMLAHRLREHRVSAMILPQVAVMDEPVIRIDSKAFHMGPSSYSFDQIESLITKIQQAQDET